MTVNLDQKNVGLFLRKTLKQHTKVQKVKVKLIIEFMTWNRKIYNIDKLRNQKIDKIPTYR